MGTPHIHAVAENVIDTTKSVTIAENGVIVQTVEHVLSALWGMGVDNCYIKLNGIEPPCGDGSAALYVAMLKVCGIRAFMVPYLGEPIKRKILNIQEPLSMEFVNGGYMTVNPAAVGTTYTSMLQFPEIGHQIYTHVCPVGYAEEVAPARTFASIRDILAAKRMGLSAHTDLTNCMVYDDKGQWRHDFRNHWWDEPARHKVLDLIGDMALVGVRIKGHITAYKTGHEDHVMMAQKLRMMYQTAEAEPNSNPTDPNNR